MKSDDFTYEMNDGKKIHTYRWLPSTKVDIIGAVQIAHGMTEHAKRYGDFAKALTDEGYAVYANDHRGHGKTAGSYEDMGHFSDHNGWNLLLEDMHKLTSIIKKEQQGVPLFLFGHSMGSFLSRNYIHLYGRDINGSILSGTTWAPEILLKTGKMIATRECKKRGKRSRSILMSMFFFGNFNKGLKPMRTEYDWITSDSAQVDKFISDPMCGRIPTSKFFVDLMGGMIEIQKIENIRKIPSDLPLFFLSGKMDPVGGKDGVKVKKTVGTFSKTGIKNISLKLYEGKRHEMLTEVNKEQVYRDIIGWLHRQVRPVCKNKECR